MPFGDANNAKELEELLKQKNTEENCQKAGELFGMFGKFDVNTIGNALLGENQKYSDAYRKVGFSATGNPRLYSVFAVWLMGEKNLSLEETTKIMPTHPDFQKYVDEFHKFLESHPAKDVDQKTEAESVRAWTKLYLKSSEKLKEYKFPDIDYSDPRQFAPHAHTLSVICGLQIDVFQEFELLTKGRKEFAAELTDNSTEKLAEAMSPWSNLQELSTKFKEAYFDPIKDSTFTDLSKGKTIHVEPIVNARLFLKQNGKQIAGKTMGDYLQTKAKENQVINIYRPYAMATAASSAKQTYTSEKTTKFLLGQPTDIMKDYEKKLADTEGLARMYCNDGTYLSGSKIFQDEFFRYAKGEREANKANEGADADNYVITLPLLFADGNIAPQKMLEELKSEKAASLYAFLNNSFGKITNQGLGSDDFNKAIGITSATQLFKINGKTPEELWGKKYADVKSEGDKELLYKAEIAREMMYGTANVTIDIYAINNKNEIVKAKPFTAMQSNDVMVQAFPFYRGLADLHERLSEQLEILKNTQSDKEKNFVKEKGTEGSPEYRAMLEALKKLVDITDVNKDYEIKDLYKGMNDLKKASEKYYKTHASSLFKGYTKNKGKVRVDISNTFKGDYLVSEFAMLKELYTLTDIEPDELVDRSMNPTKFSAGIKKMQEMCAVKGTTLDDDRIYSTSNYLSNKIYDFSCRKKDLRNQLTEAAKGLHTKTEKGDYWLSGLYDEIDGKKAVANAKKIVKNEYMKFIRKVSPKSDVSIEELEEVIIDDKFTKNFHSKVDNILNDDKFIKLMASDPENCVAKYEEIKARQNAKYHNFMKETSEAYEKLSQKYPDPAVCEFKWDLAEKQLKSWENEMNREEDQITSIRTYAFDNKDAFNALNTPINEKTLAENPKLAENLVQLNYIKDTLSHIVALSIMKDEIQKSKDPQEAGMMKAINPEELKNTQKLVLKALEKDDNLFKRDANTFCGALTMLWEPTERKIKKFVAEEKAKEANKGKKMDEPKKGANKGAVPKAPNK